MGSKRAGISPFCLLILLQSLLYGFGDPISKAAYETVDVYALLSVRYLIAWGLLFLLFGKRVIKELRSCPVRIWLVPSLCIAGGYVISNVALRITDATSVAFLRSLSTVMTPLLAFFVHRAKYDWRHLPIQVLLVVGLYLMCGVGGLSGFGLGEAAALLSALMMAGALVFSGDAVKRMDAVVLTTVQAAASAAMALACAFLFEGGIHLERVSLPVWGTILYLAVCCTLAGYLLQNKALEHLSARTVALLQCISPVLTALFSFLILGERLNLLGITGAVIILACVILETLTA